MALVSRTIPGLYNGVSQQSPAIRHENQCEALDNGYATVVRGVAKRPPTEYVTKALSAVNIADANSFVHFIHRDQSEQYAVIFKSDQTISVFDLQTGTQKTVQYAAGTQAYLPTNPKDELAVVTVADYTFVVNKTKVVAKGTASASGTLGTSFPSMQALNDTTRGGIYPPSGEHEITGDESTNFDSFYVQGDGETWREISKPAEVIEWDDTTMPHALVRISETTFELRKVTWVDRACGDDNVNAFPSLVGNTIDDVFFHRNRFGFTSGENVILSESGEFFNLFRTTNIQLLDTDRIDISAAHNKVSLLKYAVPYNKSLYLFSPQAQFVMDGGDLLTPRTAGIDQTTEYEVAEKVRPVGSGSTLFFATPGGAHMNIREYYVEEDSVSNVAANVTAHVPKYIPKNLVNLTASTNFDTLFALSTDTPNVLYIYKYYWRGNEKVQSAWSTWTFSSDVVILGMECIENYLYIVCNRASGTYIERVDLEPFSVTDTMGFKIHLDRLTTVTGSFDGGADETTFTLPYEIDLGNSVELVLSDDFTGQVGQLLDSSDYIRPNDYTVKVPGDYSGGNVYVGEPFTFTFEFSQQFMRDREESILDGDLRLRTMTIYYTDTAYFTAKVTPQARNPHSVTQTHTIESQYTGKTVGSDALILGQPSFQSGFLRFPVFSDAKTVTIELINDSPLGCVFTKAEWMGNYTARSKRVG